MKKTRSRSDDEDEPELPDGEWYDYGDDSIWVVGHTSGGFPYGPRRSDMLRSLEREAPRAGWARAKALLGAALARRSPESAVEIGRVTRAGQGLSRDAFVAFVELVPDRDALSGPYAVLLPRWDAIEGVDARTRREANLLSRLARLDLPFRVPIVLATLPDGGRLALVRTWLEGIPLELRAGRQQRVRPWEVVGQLAATVHSLDLGPFADILPGDDTRRAHAETRLLAWEDVGIPEARAALAWAREHLPPPDPSVFVHGDLLGQNILLDPEHPPALIDWEYSRRGDPAYDLAIVTRGVRRPFQMAGGLQRLLEAYARNGGCAVQAEHVHVHEIGILGAQYRDSFGASGDQTEQPLTQLRSLLRRLGA